MSWSPAFVASLDTADVPRVWFVRVVQLFEEPTFNGEYLMGTTSRDGADPILCGPPSMVGSKVSIESWQSTIGGMTFDLSGDLTTFRQRVTRGTHVEVILRSGGHEERIAIGRVTALRYQRGVLTMGISDALALLDCRPVTDGQQTPLFYGYHPDNRSSTTLDADYTVGDTTVTVVSTAGFTREVGATGCIQIGDFLLTYTGTTGTTFTGVSTAGKFVTTAADAVVGDAVTEVALLSGHPLTVAKKVLQSTGAGTNGAFDVYPAGWGFAIPEEYVDDDDIDQERMTVVRVASGIYNIDLLVTEHQESPRSWVTAWLAALGVYPVMHQGSLSFRGATWDDDNMRAPVGYVGDEDIDQSIGVSSDWWDPNKPTEYGSNPVYWAAGYVPSGDDDIQTLPGAFERPIDLSALLYDYADKGEVMTEVYNRTYLFYRRVGEVLTLPLSGLGGMAYTVGDRVTFTSLCPFLRYDYQTGLNVLIIQVSPDPRANRVTIRALYLPGEEVWPLYAAGGGVSR